MNGFDNGNYHIYHSKNHCWNFKIFSCESWSLTRIQSRKRSITETIHVEAGLLFTRAFHIKLSTSHSG